jgi:WD40 repeat protein
MVVGTTGGLLVLSPLPPNGTSTVVAAHAEQVQAVDISADGRHIASASRDQTARVWTSTGAPLLVLHGHRGDVSAVVFSPDGGSVVTCGHDGTMRLWDAHDGRSRRVVRAHDGECLGLAFSSGGDLLVSAGNDGRVRLWAPDGEPVRSLVSDGRSWSVKPRAFHPSEDRFVATAGDGRAYVLETSGEGGPMALSVSDLPLVGVVWSADGTALLAGSKDYTAVRLPAPEPALDHERLWTLTRYCPSVRRRQYLGDMPEDQKAADLARCHARVQHGDPGARAQ